MGCNKYIFDGIYYNGYSKRAKRRNQAKKSQDKSWHLAEIAEKNLPKRQESDLEAHRKVSYLIDKDNPSGELRGNYLKKNTISRGAKMSHSRSARSLMLINKAYLDK